MSNKPEPSAPSRHSGSGHPKSCPICNPKKKQNKWRERKAPYYNHIRDMLNGEQGE